jgi:hypothetical protein
VKKVLKEFQVNLIVEKNGVGVAHVKTARDLGIGFDEWTTSAVNRPIMVSEFEEACRKELIIETYADAENEARDMIYLTNNRAEAPVGKHDDMLFARFLAYQALRRPSPKITLL